MIAIEPQPRSPALLRENFLALKAEKGLRTREAAQQLGVSEGEVIASHVGQRGEASAIRLKGPFPELLPEIGTLGNVMALTRNQSVVHEKVGTYQNLSHQGHMGLALGEEIDLRIFYSHWQHAYALTEETTRGPQRSLQFFGADGGAIHKIFLKPESSLEAWLGLTDKWTHDDQAPGQSVSASSGKNATLLDAEIDVDGLQLAWAGMQDTHEFFGLLKKFKVARTQALRLAGADFAWQVENRAARTMLEAAATAKLAIMAFVGNPGMIQIHTGPVENIKVMDKWLNVLDPGFNLHLREDLIAQSWVVKKPTTEGDVTSLELFDTSGETMVMFFGKRKPGIPELPQWQALAASLPRLGQADQV